MIKVLRINSYSKENNHGNFFNTKYGDIIVNKPLDYQQQKIKNSQQILLMNKLML